MRKEFDGLFQQAIEDPSETTTTCTKRSINWCSAAGTCSFSEEITSHNDGPVQKDITFNVTSAYLYTTLHNSHSGLITTNTSQVRKSWYRSKHPRHGVKYITIPASSNMGCELYYNVLGCR